MEVIMLKIVKCVDFGELETYCSKATLIDFLYTHLDKFRDQKSAIAKAIDYAYSSDAGKGGFVLLALDDKALVGALVMIKTGMQEFIPEYTLVYIAVDASKRGQGIGKQIIEKAQQMCDGNIALHVEYDNPAQRLYERLGFSSKYAEMRWNKE